MKKNKEISGQGPRERQQHIITKLGEYRLVNLFFINILLLHPAMACERSPGEDYLRFAELARQFMRERGTMRDVGSYEMNVSSVSRSNVVSNYHFKLSEELKENSYIVVLFALKKVKFEKGLGGGYLYVLMDSGTGSVLDWYRTR